jgi:hypothetical protein
VRVSFVLEFADTDALRALWCFKGGDEPFSVRAALDYARGTAEGAGSEQVDHQIAEGRSWLDAEENPTDV